MEKLKHLVETLERFLDDVKGLGYVNREELEVFIQVMQEPYTKLAEDLHRENLISADTLFTVTRNLDQLKQIIEEATNLEISRPEFVKVCALIEHKIEILRLNFINASNHLRRDQSHTA